jgi:hypothetical protein
LATSPEILVVSSWGKRKKLGKKGGLEKICDPVSWSDFKPFMWDFMWGSHPKLAKIGVFVQNLLIQKANKSNT